MPKNREMTPGDAALMNVSVSDAGPSARRRLAMSTSTASMSFTEISPLQAGAVRFRRPGFAATISALRGKSARSAKKYCWTDSPPKPCSRSFT